MTSITPSPEMVERAARSDAAFDGRDFDRLGRVDRQRYLDRAQKSLAAALSCPDGFRLVPAHLTDEMVEAAFESGYEGTEDHLRKDYRAMLAASPAPAVDNAGWRPIASFPKDGELYLVCDDRSLDGDHQVVFWDEDLETPFKLHTPDGPAFHEAAFTHWQPLPSAPSQDAPPPRSLSNKD